ncbi:MAG: GNAT family N-acetyltransferase, partial [Photobacterium halotolerans]
FNHEALANLTQIDYDREMAFIAVRLAPDSHTETDIIGVSRAVSDPNNEEAEFAVLVRSDLKGQGLGSILLNTIIQYCKQRGLQRLTGITMPNNQGMLSLARKSGFQVEIHFEDKTAELLLVLQDDNQPERG